MAYTAAKLLAYSSEMPKGLKTRLTVILIDKMLFFYKKQKNSTAFIIEIRS